MNLEQALQKIIDMQSAMEHYKEIANNYRILLEKQHLIIKMLSTINDTVMDRNEKIIKHDEDVLNRCAEVLATNSTILSILDGVKEEV